MLTQRIKIIILAIIILLLSIVTVVVFALKNRSITENNTTKKSILEELKKNIPEISAKQIAFYRTTADNNEIATCLGREDEKNCIAAVAFIKNDKSLCYIHDHHDNAEGHGDDEETSLKKCVNNILRNGAPEEVAKCKNLDGDDFFNCVENLFSIYEKKDECVNLLDTEARMVCEDVFIYEDTYLKYDRNLCAQIKYEKLNKYCLATIIDKNQDTDGDGLTDLDEINIYHTHYLFKDTDGDGISDFDEVKSMNYES